MVLDHVLVTVEWRQWAAESFASRQAWLVGVHCDPEVLAEREPARGDRTPGQAVRQHNVVHQNCVYDTEVDTTHVSADDAAAAILAHMATSQPRGFAAMRAKS